MCDAEAVGGEPFWHSYPVTFQSRHVTLQECCL